MDDLAFWTSIVDLWQMSNDWVRLLLVCCSLAGLLATCEVMRHRYRFSGEVTRKTIHMASGFLACLFPWIFHSATPIVVLACGMTTLFIAARYFKLFPSLFAVDRRSAGDIYFILSVLILYLLTPDNRLYYCIPLLTLTIADALAAILGKQYQKITYAVEHSFKSIEGSLVFLLSTFLCVHIPLLIFSDIGRIESLLIPLELAILVTCLESICIHGIDNIIIPLSTYYILSHPASSYDEIGSRILVLLTLMICVFYAGYRLQFLAFSGMLVVQLFLYSLYALHGFDWLFPAALAMLVFGSVYYIVTHYFRSWLEAAHTKRQLSLPEQKSYQVLPTFYVVLVPSILALSQDVCAKMICPYNPLLDYDLYPIFISSISVFLSLALITLLQRLICAVQTFYIQSLVAVCFLTTLIIAGIYANSLVQWWITLACSLLACCIQTLLRNCCYWPSAFPWPWRAFAISGTLAIILIWWPASYFGC